MLINFFKVFYGFATRGELTVVSLHTFTPSLPFWLLHSILILLILSVQCGFQGHYTVNEIQMWVELCFQGESPSSYKEPNHFISAILGSVLQQKQPFCKQAGCLPAPVSHGPSARTHPHFLQGRPGLCQQRYFKSCHHSFNM